jgi:RNA polymerase primary sigma factor
MATKATERDEGETAAPEQQSDGPLLDLSDAAVKRMIKLAKKRGYVTYDELNEVLPSEEFSSEQIEDVLGQLSEMGINVVESEEAEEGEKPEAEEEEAESGDLVETSQARAVVVRETTTKEPTDRTDDPVRQAHRGWPRGNDRGSLRKPADLPGHHHLARRAGGGPGSPARHHRP